MMNAVKSFLQKKQLLIRIILSYLFVVLLVIGVLTLIITSKVSANLTEELTASTDRSIEQSYNTANIILNSAYKNFAKAYASEDIQAGFYGQLDTAVMWRIESKLDELANTNPLVHSVYLFNFQQKVVFSSLSTVRSFSDFYDQQMLQMLSSSGPFRASIFIPRHVKFEVDTKPVDANLISVAYLRSREDPITNGVMVLNLDQQVLQNMVMDGAQSKSFQSMILNRQGTVISHTDSKIVNVNLAAAPFIKEIMESAQLKGTLQTEEQGESHRIFYIKSDSLGWIFIGDINYETLLGKVNHIKRFILWVTAAMLLIVALGGLFFTILIYGPIHKLIKNVSKSPISMKNQASVSEFDLLLGTFSRLEEKVQDLQASMAGYQYHERREVLKSLIRGGWSNEADILGKLRQLGIGFTGQGFSICILRLDSYRELTEKYNGNDLALLKYAVTNIADELGAEPLYTVTFDAGDDCLVAIVNTSQEMTSEITSWLKEVQHNVERFLKLSVTASMGNYAEGLSCITESWQKAFTASRYRIAMGRGSCIPTHIEDTRESVQDVQSSAIEKQVVDSMKQGDLAKMHEALCAYIDILRQAPFDEMMLLLTQLLMAVTRAAKSMASADSGDSRMDIGYLGQQLYQSETLDDINHWFGRLCETIVGLRDKQSSQKNLLIIEKLKKHIHEHYADPNLTVEVLAEVGGLSVNYMRKIFKDMEGISITNYLSEFRFEKAKELLISTDQMANRIGELVGFENTKYFYVSFKKHYGKTPDHYRKSHQADLTDPPGIIR